MPFYICFFPLRQVINVTGWVYIFYRFAVHYFGTCRNRQLLKRVHFNIISSKKKSFWIINWQENIQGETLIITMNSNVLIIKGIFTCFYSCLRKLGSVNNFLHHINRSLDEDRIVSDVVPFLHLHMRDELGIPESQHAVVQTTCTYAPHRSRSRSLEVLPVGIWTEALSDVLRFGECWVTLVQQREGDTVRERPLQQAIILAREHSDVERQVCSFTTAITIREHGYLKTVSITMRVECRAEELWSAIRAVSGLLEVTAIVGDFPKQRAILVSGKFFYTTPQVP